MPLSMGSRVGPYVVTAPLGASMQRAVGGAQTSLRVVLNWAEALKKKP
jgi:hypothetical protein